jgi:hypothetical protein
VVVFGLQGAHQVLLKFCSSFAQVLLKFWSGFGQVCLSFTSVFQQWEQLRIEIRFLVQPGERLSSMVKKVLT